MRSIIRKALSSARQLAQRESNGPFLLAPSHRPFFSGGEKQQGTTPGDAEKNAEKLIELMSKSSAMQAMMLSALPPSARQPDAIQAMLKDPGMRQKLVKMISSMNLRIPSHVLQSMSAGGMDETFTRAREMGVDPQVVFAKLQSHPHLLAKLQDPRVMEAFTRISQNPLSAVHVDPETMAVITEIRQALGHLQPGQVDPSSSVKDAQPPLQSAVAEQPDAAVGTEGLSHTSSPTTSEAPLGLIPPPPMSPPEIISPSPTPLMPPMIDLGTSQGAITMARLISLDPELSRRVSENPKILKAIQVIAKSPWRTIMYIWDREVMDCFTALNNLMKGKDAWGKKA